MLVKNTVSAWLDEHAQQIIDNCLSEEFHSHDFIKQLIKHHEERYVREMNGSISSGNGIFRSLHSQIGLYLSQKREILGIEPRDKVSSENIKGNVSENQGWRKITNTSNP